MKSKILFFYILIGISTFAQTKRDIILKDSIISPINSGSLAIEENYLKTYSLLKKLDAEFGYEKDIHVKILEYSYLQNDSINFKNDLTILVKEYGFKIDYLNATENYYNDITIGKLATWFKEMYLKNHFIWLNNNFEKLSDIRILNEVNVKDQVIARLSSEIITLELKPSDSVKIHTRIKNLNCENLQLIYDISKKNNVFVLSKKFPIIQNRLNNSIVHNFQTNISKTWELLFPLVKKAYIKNEIDNVIFQNYDFYCFLKNGYQEFNSYKIEQIPKQFRKNNNSIPLKDEKEFVKIKSEFKWN
ncbi:MAG: hypothetical protein O9282_07880 [Flavobacterium sp.]|jgi:hypothetical protein|uniref:hypothetical protein n=1 Tax=Flavobacterium sp. TaxID=239 RepID=UPI0022BDB1FE|nr:hypothetical protein [Flavobacterium sp.]MCZ8089428.1 hypothetical protein [Flavobacterium sp.]MCZ8331214.1 hypothetical protein [Flavobacterium sp.]